MTCAVFSLFDKNSLGNKKACSIPAVQSQEDVSALLTLEILYRLEITDKRASLIQW